MSEKADLGYMEGITARRDSLKEQVARLTSEIGTLNAHIKEVCPHPQTVKKTSYTEGGYYDRSEYKKWTECAFCGEVTDFKRTAGSFG